MLDLSYIVPVYNVEKYLGKCIDSLLCQGLKTDEYEIILVDDGSTDDSGNIAEQYAERSSNIKVVHQPNSGLGAARNAGTMAATADYVQYVDSDDYLEPHTTPQFIRQLRHDNLDVLRIDYRNVDESGAEITPNKQRRPYADYSDSVCSGKEFLNRRLGFACYAVQFVIRRDIAQRTPFATGIYYEDAEWAPRMLKSADRVASTSTVGYNYLLRQGSITKAPTAEKQRKIIHDQLQLLASLHQEAQRWDNREWFDSMLSQTVVALLDNIVLHCYDEKKALLGELKKLGILPASRRRTSKSAARKLLLINLSSSLYCTIKHLLTKRN